MMSRKLPTLAFLIVLEFLTLAVLFVMFRGLIYPEPMTLNHIVLFLFMNVGSWTSISALVYFMVNPEKVQLLRVLFWPTKIILLGITPLYFLAKGLFPVLDQAFFPEIHITHLITLLTIQLLSLIALETTLYISGKNFRQES